MLFLTFICAIWKIAPLRKSREPTRIGAPVAQITPLINRLTTPCSVEVTAACRRISGSDATISSVTTRLHYGNFSGESLGYSEIDVRESGHYSQRQPREGALRCYLEHSCRQLPAHTAPRTHAYVAIRGFQFGSSTRRGSCKLRLGLWEIEAQK